MRSVVFAASAAIAAAAAANGAAPALHHGARASTSGLYYHAKGGSGAGASSVAGAAAGSAHARRRTESAATAGWPTEYANTLNTGVGLYGGPAEADGDCLATFFADRITDTTQFIATGVSSSSSDERDNANFFGGTDNVLRIVNKVSNTVNEWACDLKKFWPQSPKANGIVASPTTWAVSGGWDRVAVASTDGRVYGLDWRACVTNSFYCNASSFPVSVRESESPSVASGGVRGGAGVDADPVKCVVWDFTPKYRTAPAFGFQSPPRFLAVAGLLASPSGLLLVSDTATGSFTGGVLHALNPDTGKEVWNYTAVMGNASTSYGLVGVAPAWDGTATGAIFLAFGTGVVALDPKTGKVVGNWTGAGDRVASSPVLGAPAGGAATNLYLHTTLGTVWQLALSGSVSSGAVKILPVWSCDYSVDTYWADKTRCTTFGRISNFSFSTGPTETEHAAEVVSLPLHGARRSINAPLEFASIVRSDAGVAGGWSQTTTAAQRAAFDAAVRTRYAAAFPTLVTTDPSTGQLISSPPLVTEAVLAGAPATPENLALLEVALMASALPPESRAALESGADWAGSTDAVVASYARLDTAGRPAPLSAGLYTSTYPYSTPALSGTKLVVSQFAALGSPTAGVFAADTLRGGDPYWVFSNFTFPVVVKGKNITFQVINFTTSRSSPVFDSENNLYVGSDVSFPSVPGGSESLPVMWVFEPGANFAKLGEYQIKWFTNVGVSDALDVFGSASPTIRDGVFNEVELYVATSRGAVGLTDGKTCDNSFPFECSGKGSCSCLTGVCDCSSAGPCFQGSGCSSTCLNGGTCSGTTTAVCACINGYSGPTCAVRPSPSPAPPATRFIDTPGGKAAIAVPVTLALLALLGVGWWRTAHPKAPWADIMPASMQHAMGVRKYEPVALSGNAAAAIGSEYAVFAASGKGGYGTTL